VSEIREKIEDRKERVKLKETMKMKEEVWWRQRPICSLSVNMYFLNILMDCFQVY